MRPKSTYFSYAFYQWLWLGPNSRQHAPFGFHRTRPIATQVSGLQQVPKSAKVARLGLQIAQKYCIKSLQLLKYTDHFLRLIGGGTAIFWSKTNHALTSERRLGLEPDSFS